MLWPTVSSQASFIRRSICAVWSAVRLLNLPTAHRVFLETVAGTAATPVCRLTVRHMQLFGHCVADSVILTSAVGESS